MAGARDSRDRPQDACEPLREPGQGGSGLARRGVTRNTPVETFPRQLAERRSVRLSAAASAAGTVPALQCPRTPAGISGTLLHVAGHSACRTRRHRLRNRPGRFAGTGFGPGRRRHARDRAGPVPARSPDAGSLSRHGRCASVPVFVSRAHDRDKGLQGDHAAPVSRCPRTRSSLPVSCKSPVPVPSVRFAFNMATHSTRLSGFLARPGSGYSGSRRGFGE